MLLAQLPAVLVIFFECPVFQIGFRKHCAFLPMKLVNGA